MRRARKVREIRDRTEIEESEREETMREVVIENEKTETKERAPKRRLVKGYKIIFIYSFIYLFMHI